MILFVQNLMPSQYFNKFSFREKSDGKKLVMAQVEELLLNIQQCSQTIKIKYQTEQTLSQYI